MNHTISVIVPVYKVEQYLPRCVESLLAQTYKDFEIVLVDDGSPDRCPGMCDAYAGKYEKIRVLHKKNGGLSDARNAGIKVVHSPYVTFVDSDDYVNPLYLELLMKGVEDGRADISMVGFEKVYDSDEVAPIAPGHDIMETVSAREALAEMLYQKFHDVMAWGILLPYTIAKEYPFPYGKLYEDLYTTYKYFLSANKVTLVHAPLYYYLQRGDSIMARRDDKFLFDYIKGSDIVIEACKGDVLLEGAAKSHRFSSYCRILGLVPDLEQRFPEIYNKIKDTLMSERISTLADPRTRNKNKAAAAALFFGTGCFRRLYRLAK